jgi:hypothetical protein
MKFILFHTFSNKHFVNLPPPPFLKYNAGLLSNLDLVKLQLIKYDIGE